MHTSSFHCHMLLEECNNLRMMEGKSTNIWVGSELGYLKSVDTCKSIVKNYGEGNEDGRFNAPNALAWADVKEGNILCGTKNGKIRTFCTGSEAFSTSSVDCGDAPIVGVTVHSEKILACNVKGSVSIWDGSDMTAQKSIGENICAVKQSKKQCNFVAFGGKENNLKLYDIEHLEKPVFTAKNVRNDFLDLRQPVWVNAIDFIGNEESRIIVGTGHHKVQLYDTRKQRRPIDEILWEEYPITSISLGSDGNDLIVGNTTGSMASIDLRKKQKNGSFKGNKGSITSIKCHQSQGFVVCTGLDRFLRIYDISTRGILQKFYLKSRLTSILLSETSYGDEIFGKSLSSNLSRLKKSALKNETDDADDSIWNEMELVADEAVLKSRKKKTLENPEASKHKKIKMSEDGD